jgi:L-amino acid N-acyltransferase YncA
MIETVQYHPSHGFELLERRVKETDLVLISLGDWQKVIEQLVSLGSAYTLLVDGKVEACAGIARHDPGFGECWMLIPETARRMVVTRWAIRVFLKEIETHNFRRLQAFVLCGFEAGKSFAEYFGFEREGIVRKYGPNGEDMILYARVF